MCRLHIHGGKVEVMLTPHLEEFDAEALFFRNLTYERSGFAWLADNVPANALSPPPPEALKPADVVVMAVAHKANRDGGWALLKRPMKPGGGFVADVPALLDRGTAPTGFTLWRL